MVNERDLARSTLVLLEEIQGVIESLDAEPVWQVRHLLAEPEKGSLQRFAEWMDRVRAQVTRMRSQDDAMRALAEGMAELDDLTPGAVADMQAITEEGVRTRDEIARILAWAREMKDPNKVARALRLN